MKIHCWNVRVKWSFGVWQVNKFGNVIYDEHVRPVERGVDFRTQVSGIRPRDLKKGSIFNFLENFILITLIYTNL